jgi:hypothetical protein
MTLGIFRRLSGDPSIIVAHIQQLERDPGWQLVQQLTIRTLIDYVGAPKAAKLIRYIRKGKTALFKYHEAYQFLKIGAGIGQSLRDWYRPKCPICGRQMQGGRCAHCYKVTDEQHNTYTVARVLDSALDYAEVDGLTGGPLLKYKVLWEGYPDEPTWEPYTHMVGAEGALGEFHQQYKRKPGPHPLFGTLPGARADRLSVTKVAPVLHKRIKKMLRKNSRV